MHSRCHHASSLPVLGMQMERKETIAAVGEDLFSVAVDQPFRFPAAFTFVLRAFTTLEGLGKALDPGFQFVTVAQPYAQELLNLKVGTAAPVNAIVLWRVVGRALVCHQRSGLIAWWLAEGRGISPARSSWALPACLPACACLL